MALTYASKLRQLYPFKPPSTAIDHLVIGGGAVGLSVAAGLVNTCGRDRTTFLVERNSQVSVDLLLCGGCNDLMDLGLINSSGRRRRK